MPAGLGSARFLLKRGMDIARPELKKRKRRRQYLIGASVVLLLAVAGIGLARLGPAVLTQIDEDHAPFGPPLDELARDAAPVAAGSVDPVREK